MKISGLVKLTLLDYPDKVAATVFTSGCNLRCPFCHNASLVIRAADAETISQEDVLAFLSKRAKVLEGVCVSGGEPLLQNDLEKFLEKVKTIGYSVKLDTNGTFPDKLEHIVNSKLVDYVAMDVKNSKSLYNATCGCITDIDAVSKSVEFLKSGAVPYEFRTTVTGTFHSERGMTEMGEWLKGAEKLYLQQFTDSGDLIDSSVCGADVQTLKKYRDILSAYVGCVAIRGVDVD